MKRLLVTLSLAAAIAAVSAAPAAAQTTPPAPAGATKPATPATKKPAGAGRTVEITGGDDMKYSLTSIAAKPGETLHIVLKATGTIPKIAMAHNFIALNAGVDAAKFSQDAMTARDTDYVPAARKADILAST
jgi:azurin